MKINGWKYYNNAAIPDIPVCLDPNMTPVENGDIWQLDGSPILARWTTNFDCKNETNWWYVIKDTPFDISQLKAKHRYIINKGINSFECKKINPAEYVEQLHKIFLAAYSAWPKKYRPNICFEGTKNFMEQLSKESSAICYGAFHKETNELCGFSKCELHDTHIEFQMLRVKPEYEKQQINAALVHCLVSDFSSQLQEGGKFILDGARSISHETHFQDYLEKYFGFRKAYCNLHIEYNPKIKWAVKTLFVFRKIFAKFDNIGIMHKINAVLKMEEIVSENKGK